MVLSQQKLTLTCKLFLHFILISLTLAALFTLVPTLQPIVKISAVVIAIILLGLDVFSVIKKEIYFSKTIRLVTVCFFAAAITLLTTFYLTKFIVFTDMYGFEKALAQVGSEAKLIYFAICFAQPIVLPIPEIVTVAGASTVFGPITALVLGFSGTLSGIIVMYSLARFGGQKMVSRLIKEVHLKKYQGYVQKNEVLFLSIMFIIPILPDEVICIGAGLGAVSFKRFFWIAAFSKLMTAAVFSFSLDLARPFSISSNKIILCISIFSVISLAGIAFIKRKYLNPNKKKADSIE